MNPEDDIPSLRPLYLTLDKAANVMAAFISVTNSNEQLLPSLMEAAQESLKELAHWAESIKLACDMEEDEARH